MNGRSARIDTADKAMRALYNMIRAAAATTAVHRVGEIGDRFDTHKVIRRYNPDK